ncbi:MAG: hypothetical protein IKE24_03825 [Clostridia bacterium]|nr:hypothetical protein [Clostridia bacterium]
MSRERRKKEQQEAAARERETAASYYELKTKAVEDLVTANEENSPPVSRAEIRKYTSRGKLKVADWVKLLAIKWWFAAAVCFFFIWGLGTYFPHTLDLLVITGVALGFVTDLLTNNVLRFIAPTKGANDRWMMFPKKGFISLPLNLLHAGVVLFLVYTAYNALNVLIISAGGMEADAVPLGVEPILFGLLYLGFDMLLITLKHVAQNMLRDAEKKADSVGGKRPVRG